jgi:hypothetical protein
MTTFQFHEPAKREVRPKSGFHRQPHGLEVVGHVRGADAVAARRGGISGTLGQAGRALDKEGA